MKTLVLVLALCLPFPATAADEEKLPDGFGWREPQVSCNSVICMMPRSEFQDLMQSNQALGALVLELTAKLEKNPPKCANVEVPPPIKKLPPIKRENDT